MALILAIEPDRRQSSKIAAIVKNKLHAEIVSGDTTEHAVEALAGRVPDLILTSMLLSRKDDAALADWLRASDEAGAHVQTLVIPVLGGGYGDYKEEGSGLLSRLRGRSSDSTDGCDPEIFADQIREYLEHAAEARRHAALRLEDMKEAAAAAEARSVESAADEPPPADDSRSIYTPPADDRRSSIFYPPSADAADNPEPTFFEVEAVVPIDAAPVGTDSLPGPEPADDGDAWSEIALGGEETDRTAENAERPAYSLDDDDAASLELTSEPIDLQRFVDELTSQAAIETPPPQPRVQGDDVLAEFEEALDVIVTDDPEPNRPNSNSEADSEVLTPLVGATAWPHLDSTVAKVAPGSDGAATEEAAARQPAAARPRSRKKARAASPQADWSLFDPDQCGFSDLLAKLDQMSD
jgi:hypothetical protein